jgi:hypothetical protein
LLFDGKSLDHWRGYKDGPVPSGWIIENGTLAKSSPVADIVSNDEFGNFELELEWKIGDAGNSGIFYRGTEEYNRFKSPLCRGVIMWTIELAMNTSTANRAGSATTASRP